MKPMTMDQIAGAVAPEESARLGEASITSISTDSRRIKPGSLFIALRGEKFDGHDFLKQVQADGAAAAIVDRTPPATLKMPCILVDDTRKALGRLGALVRRGLACPVIAVVGSNGKTSTKNLIDAALRELLKGTVSPKSFNNDIGVPLTIFASAEDDQYLVLEVGTNHHGEIANLATIAQPDIAVITNCAAEHLEGLTDLAGVRKENAAILGGLRPGGLLIIFGDDAKLLAAVAEHRGPRVTFGFSRDNDLWAADVNCGMEGTSFLLCDERMVFVPHLGRHAALNALAAIAVARKLGVSDDGFVSGLYSATSPEMRLQLQRFGGISVLNDAYNANPASMRAALELFSQLPAHGRRVAVLGDMRELGESAQSLHREVGRVAARANLDALVCVGADAGWIAESAIAAGMRPDCVSRYADAASATAITNWLAPGDLVLLKGSRAMTLERVAAAFGRESASVRKVG
jgi:UDP-N-acetylmuramoyl-tripeptide--D-alanyl-D-alanine ligase